MQNRNIILTTILFALGSFAVPQKTQGVSPPPDGGYPGGNTAEGTSALLSRTTGMYNTAVGIYSLRTLTDGSFCTGVGAGALLSNTTASNAFCIGTDGNNVSDSCYIGNIFISTVNDSAVFINSNGRLGIATSSRRLKEEIKPMDKASEALLALKPVTFRYKKVIDQD